MNDELDRIRSLRGDAPAPSDDWVQDTRAELLAMAAAPAPPRRRARWRDFVGGCRHSWPVRARLSPLGPSCW